MDLRNCMKIYSRSTFKQGVPQFLDLGLIEVVSYLPAGPWRDLIDRDEPDPLIGHFLSHLHGR